MQQYVTNAARQELALREAAERGNRHMRRKGKKIFRDVLPPRPWFALEHPEHGMVGIRTDSAGAKLEVRLPARLADEQRAEVVEWGVAELKKPAEESNSQKSSPE